MCDLQVSQEWDSNRALFALGPSGQFSGRPCCPPALDRRGAADTGQRLRVAVLGLVQEGYVVEACADVRMVAVEAFGDGGSWFSTRDELIANLQESLDGNCNVLVKGSRSMGMERVVNALRNYSEKARGK